MAEWQDIGINAIGNVVSNLLTFGANRANEDHARAENYRYSEMAADNADKRQRGLIEDYYTPEAQLSHLRNAGLSPSVMYGGSGASGTTGAAQGNGANVAPAYANLDPMTLAQIRLMNAQANEAQSNADEKNGDNAMGFAKIRQILADAGLKGAETSLVSAETAGQVIDNWINDQTKETQVQTITDNAKKVCEEAKKVEAEAERENLQLQYDIATFDARVETANKALDKLISEINLNNAQAEQARENAKVVQDYLKLHKAELGTKISQFEKEQERIKQMFADKLEFENKEMWVNNAFELTESLLYAVSSLRKANIGAATAEAITDKVEKGKNERSSKKSTTTRYNKDGKRTSTIVTQKE